MLSTNAVSTIVFGLVCGTWVVSELLGPVRWSGLREGQQRDAGPLLVVSLSAAGGFILCLLFPLLLPQACIPWQPAIFFVGCAVTLFGMGWRWYAIRTLGSYFTATLMLHPHQRVVQHGPYRFIRHPSYSGVMLIIIGLGLMIGNWVSLVTMTGGMSVILLFRIPREEHELLQHVGEPYRDYMQRTKRLIPFLF